MNNKQAAGWGTRMVHHAQQWIYPSHPAQTPECYAEYLFKTGLESILLSQESQPFWLETMCCPAFPVQDALDSAALHGVNLNDTYTRQLAKSICNCSGS